MKVKLIGGYSDGRVMDINPDLPYIEVPAIKSLTREFGLEDPTTAAFYSDIYTRKELRASDKWNPFILYVHNSLMSRGIGAYELLEILINGYKEPRNE